MKFIAKNLQIATFVKGGASLNFDCSEFTKAELKNVEVDDYTITIDAIRKKRSLNQNSLLWEIVGQICEKENGNKVETEDIYLQLLEQAGASIEFFIGIPESEDSLKRVFRIVKVVDERLMNNRQMFVYKCFLGSSNMNTKEMSILIDKALERAENDGISIDYYKEMIKEGQKDEKT